MCLRRRIDPKSYPGAPMPFVIACPQAVVSIHTYPKFSIHQDLLVSQGELKCYGRRPAILISALEIKKKRVFRGVSAHHHRSVGPSARAIRADILFCYGYKFGGFYDEGEFAAAGHLYGMHSRLAHASVNRTVCGLGCLGNVVGSIYPECMTHIRRSP